MSEEKVKALQEALTDRDPFCRGVCSVPEHQLLLYYHDAHGTDLNRIDFAHSTTEELEAFSQACQPASFGLNNEDVFDETYRKAGKMDIDSFSTSFDPRRLGIHDVIERDLLATGQTVEFELSKLNMYGKDGFFKAHQDTPRGDNMFGSLVVVLPPLHEGGQLSLRVDERHWIVDFKEQFAAATEPSICFVAFFGDIEHQVLPVTSGHRVTLTYNLHFRTQTTIPRALSGPFHDKLKERLIELVNDPETLPAGGYLGFGLCHQYAYDEKKPIDWLLDKLKGSDAALANVCKELGLPYSLRLLYGDHPFSDFNFLSRMKLGGDIGMDCYQDNATEEFLSQVVSDFGPEDIEGVSINGGGRPVPNLEDSDGMDEDDDMMEMDGLERYFKQPVTQVLEVKKMSSVRCKSSYAAYGNDLSLDSFYGTASMIISLKPKDSRERLSL